MAHIVSIVTINFNNANGLKKTINSILSQTYKEYEFVIVDGRSVDESRSIIESSIKLFPSFSWVSERDGGIYDAMNKGVRLSSGEYCIFMNSGDCFYNEKSLFESEKYLHADWEIVSGSVVTDNFSKKPPLPSDLSLSFFLKDSMNHQSTFIKRQLLLDYPYNENRRIVGDTEFFFNVLILKNVSYIQIPVIVSYCEVAGESGDLKKSLEERYIAIKELLPSRMATDVDFIVKYHNPIVIGIGNVLYRKGLRRLFYIFNKWKRRINR